MTITMPGRASFTNKLYESGRKPVNFSSFANSGARRVVSLGYFLPAPELRRYVSSYYMLAFDDPSFEDVVQAEMANIRFTLAGDFVLHWLDGRAEPASECNLFGQRCVPLGISARGPGRVFGIGILPFGWASMFGIASHELADRMLPLDEVCGALAAGTRQRLLDATSDAELAAAADAFIAALVGRYQVRDCAFEAMVEGWLLSGETCVVDELVAMSERSPRQVERLCRAYFGAPPKLLARKNRVLRAARQLALRPDTKWQDAAGCAFYDQSHFIREFRCFTGLTPTAFAERGAFLRRQSIEGRSALAQLPPIAMLS